MNGWNCAGVSLGSCGYCGVGGVACANAAAASRRFSKNASRVDSRKSVIQSSVAGSAPQHDSSSGRELLDARRGRTLHRHADDGFFRPLVAQRIEVRLPGGAVTECDLGNEEARVRIRHEGTRLHRTGSAPGYTQERALSEVDFLGGV